MKNVNVAFACLALMSCTAMPTKPSDSLTPSALNAAPSKHQGQHIKVFGLMTSSFERYGLWDSKVAFDRGNYSDDCISLLIPEAMDTSRYDMRYVEVEGDFIQKLEENVVSLGARNETTLILSEKSPPKSIK